MRAMRGALEERIGMSLPEGHPVWAWLVEHAGALITRFEVGHDGKTTYERWTGKAARMPEAPKAPALPPLEPPPPEQSIEPTSGEEPGDDVVLLPAPVEQREPRGDDPETSRGWPV